MNYVVGFVQVLISILALVSITVVAATMAMAVIMGMDKLMDARYICRLFNRCTTPNQ